MNTMSHPVAPDEIMAFLDGELPTARHLSVSTHVETCAPCREIAESARSSSHSLSTWTVPTLPTNSDFEVRLDRASKGPSRNDLGLHLPASLSTKWVLAVGAVAVLVLAVMLGQSTRTLHTTMPTPQQNRGVDVARTDNAGDLHELEQLGSNGTRSRGESKLHGVMGAVVGGAQGADRLQLTPMIARTVSLAITAKDFNASRASLDAILARHHGYAASLTANTEQNAARSLQASLRIPAAELNAAVSELKSLGRVENEAQNGEEVTQQHADLVARLKNSRETEQRLQAILQQRTGKIKDVLAVEQEIARVRGEIEQMEAEQKSLEHRVDFATIALKLTEEYKAQLNPQSPSISTRFHNAFVAGYRDAVESVVSILLFFAGYGPSLIIWLALLFPAAWLLWRRWRRSHAFGSTTAAQ
jgi:Domain of unknown function (DUF4349)/Putative zinc-finger